MFDEEILKRMSYSKCDCPPDYKKGLGIVNGICPNHDKSRLLLDGIPIEAYKKIMETKKKVDKKSSSIL